MGAEAMSDPARVGVDAAGEVVESADHVDVQTRGAELREVPAVPYKDPDNYVHVSERLADPP